MELGRLDQTVLGICGAVVVAKIRFRGSGVEGLLEYLPSLLGKCQTHPVPHAFATRSTDVIAIA
jgi:hypothetical protein